MGKRNSQKKNAVMLDSDDTDSISSSTSSMRLTNMVEVGTEEMEVEKDSMLDQWLDALYEKRGSTREKALASIIEAFSSNLQHEFVEQKFATLLHQCLNSIKKGSAKEVALASHAIGLLALTTGPGEKAQEILEESFTPISEALRLRPETSKTSSLLECLAVITFVGGEGSEPTEKSMNIMWQVAHPKLGTNVTTNRTSPAVITMVVSAWSFLLTTLDGRALNPKTWQESVSYFSTLLDKDDRLLRIAAGEALALIFEIGSLEKFCGEAKVSTDTPNEEGKDSRNLMHMHGLRNKVLNQVRVFANEASGKGTAKKDLTTQKNTFRDILDFLEFLNWERLMRKIESKPHQANNMKNLGGIFTNFLKFQDILRMIQKLQYGYTPESLMKVGGDSLSTSSWVQLIQLNFLKHFLGGGFVKHMQENQFLHDVFDFMPKKKFLSGGEHRLSAGAKRMYKSPNSALNKARTQLLNKQRMLSQDKNAGHFAVDYADA